MQTPKKTLLAALTVGAMAVVGCGGSSDTAGGGDVGGDGSKGEISLVAYSTPQVVYDQIIPAFEKTPEGEGVSFSTSYGASGDQSRAVEAGQKADYVTFSTEPDMTRLVDADLVDPNWQDTEHDGLITTSLVTFIVRKGNPKNIQTWDDLLKPGVEVLTPNPFTSGAAKWNLLGAYASGGGGAEDPEAGLQYVEDLLKNVTAQDKSGRDALQNFLGGNGDVLLSYEYEATTALKQEPDAEIEYVIPDDTVKIDIDVATTTDASAPAADFLDFALSDEAQQLFADWGYRPVNETVLEENKDKFPDPKNLTTIEDLGGWEEANKLFDLETGGAIAKLEEATGIPTED